jgi:hypothetical protein
LDLQLPMQSVPITTNVEFESHSGVRFLFRRGLLDTTLFDTVCQ